MIRFLLSVTVISVAFLNSAAAQSVALRKPARPIWSDLGEVTINYNFPFEEWHSSYFTQDTTDSAMAFRSVHGTNQLTITKLLNLDPKKQYLCRLSSAVYFNQVAHTSNADGTIIKDGTYFVDDMSCRPARD